MSEGGQYADSAQESGFSEPTAEELTGGQMLARLRQAAGVHVAALASTLKVPVARLEALEADRYDEFPDLVFMRALASSACRVLKADPAPVLALLPGGQPAPLRVGKGLNASFKESAPRGHFAAPSAPGRSRMWSAAVVLLLLAAVAVFFWPAGQDGSRLLSSLLPSIGGDTAPPRDGGSGPKAAPEPAAAAAPAAPGGPPASEAAAPSDEAPPAEVASGAAPAGPAQPPEAPAQDAAAAPEGVLVLRARAPSWVRVRAASGAVVLEKILAEGESAVVPGTPPWSVVIGKADATEVMVRGQPLDLKPLARENVARFEVK
ncbi:cytoskeleton protein RodZ [Melaminivora alkalimesophila]|uniref:Cytoskeleton protein RodZ n=2 Tax=Melaminivora alkalimesophila TaxID=1165852 RepID=A0A317RC09_9BURK|nr:helix-turn-helix domain-containing protein [Melaminivora alkalimesophila]PWW45814.1 cytoskeleton protein RodZ [Melaminivora alkalimesophila]